jgi:hypothetical protein
LVLLTLSVHLILLDLLILLELLLDLPDFPEGASLGDPLGDPLGAKLGDWGRGS